MNNNISLDDYFKHNGIYQKTVRDATPEQIKASSSNVGKDEYYDNYYNFELDHLKNCIDFREEYDIFSKMNKESIGLNNIIEVTCGSGILGCYIALNNPNYNGIDFNPYAISKAKKRAEYNSLDESIFKQNTINDLKNQNSTYDAILGHYVLCDESVDYYKKDRLKILSEMTDKLILAVNTSSNTSDSFAIERYSKAFNEIGFKFDLLTNPIQSKATWEKIFCVIGYR
jgi:hypothetical protein